MLCQTKSCCLAGDDDMPHRVVRRMKAMLLEAQALSSKAQADLRIAAAEAAALFCKLRQGLQYVALHEVCVSIKRYTTSRQCRCNQTCGFYHKIA